MNDAQFEELVRSGKILPDTLVWREGMAAWQSYREAHSPSQSSGLPPAAGAGSAAGESPEAVCAECGKMFAIQDMIHQSGALGGIYICANCKPVFLQKLAEGVEIKTGELKYARFLTRFAGIFTGRLDSGLRCMVVFFLVLIPQIRSGTPTPDRFNFLPLMLQFVFIFIKMVYQIFSSADSAPPPAKWFADCGW